jgi:N-acetylglutamate synthase-like GNAT family acetyltransferase
MLFFEIPYGTPLYDQTVWLRDLVLRKPLGLAFTVEQLAAEYKDHHLVALDDSGHLVACLVMKQLDSQRIKMRQVAVLPNCQRCGYGTDLVRYSEAWSIEHGYKVLELNAREVAVPFYDRLNYTRIDPAFTEVGILHYKMEKNL